MLDVVFGPNFQLPTFPVLGVVDPSSKPLNQKEITERSEIWNMQRKKDIQQHA